MDRRKDSIIESSLRFSNKFNIKFDVILLKCVKKSYMKKTICSTKIKIKKKLKNLRIWLINFSSIYIIYL